MMDSIYLTYPIPTRGKDKNRTASRWKTSDAIVTLKWRNHVMSHLSIFRILWGHFKYNKTLSALDLRRRCTSSMCERSICKIQIYRNEICLSSILNTNYTMQSTVGGVDVAMSKFNAQKYIMNYMDKIQGTHVPCVNNHNIKFEYKGIKTT